MKLFQVIWTDVTTSGKAYGVSSKLIVAENQHEAIKKYEDDKHFNITAKEIDIVDGYKIQVKR